jgi:hypothetical protein
MELRHNPNLQLTQVENQAARQTATRFVNACADYRNTLDSQGLPLVTDFVQLDKLLGGTHAELLDGLSMQLTELEFERLTSLKFWPNGLPRLSLQELHYHYGLDYGRLLDAYTLPLSA